MIVVKKISGKGTGKKKFTLKDIVITQRKDDMKRHGNDRR